MGQEQSGESGGQDQQIKTVVRAKPKPKSKRRLERWEDNDEDDPTMRDPSMTLLEGESKAMDTAEEEQQGGFSILHHSSDQTLALEAAEDTFGAAEVAEIPALGSFEERVLKMHASQARSSSSHQLGLAGDTPAQAEEDEDEESSDTSLENEAEVRERMMELKLREKMLEEEQESRDLMQRRDIEYHMNSMRASRVIVGMARVKLQMVNKRMKLYEEAEAAGVEANRRARTLLTWTSLLCVLQRFDEKMRTPEILKAKNERHLASLPPPPPPPPPELPPNEGDEELHEKYEEMVQRYEAKWKHEGRMVLGAEKFDEIRNRAKGPAEKQKRLVAQDRLQKSKLVLSEHEYQELLRQAWRLGDNHSALEDYDKKKFAREVNVMDIGGTQKR